MKFFKIALLSLLLTTTIACSSKTKESITSCKSDLGYAKHTVTVHDKGGEVSTFEIVSNTKVKKEDQENVKIIENTFKELYGNLEGVKVSTEYDEKDNYLIITITINLNKMKDEDINTLLENMNLSENKDKDAIIKSLETLDYTCK